METYKIAIAIGCEEEEDDDITISAVRTALCSLGFNKTTDPTAYDVEQEICRKLPKIMVVKIPYTLQGYSDHYETPLAYAKTALQTEPEAEFATGIHKRHILSGKIDMMLTCVAVVLDKSGEAHYGGIFQSTPNQQGGPEESFAINIALRAYRLSENAKRLFEKKVVIFDGR